MRNRLLTVLIVIVIAAGALGIYLYYAYQNSHYVSTDNARVAASLISITPEIPGRLISWRVSTGSRVKAGEIIGQVSTEGIAQSSAADPAALSQVGPLTASRSLIKAPIDGQIVQSSALVGEYVSPESTLAMVADTQHAYISANIDETQISRIRLGQLVDVSLDALPGHTFLGRVQQIGQATASTFSLLPDTNATTGNFTKVTQVIPVKIYLIQKPPIPLIPGMSASVRIHLGPPAVQPFAVQTARVEQARLHIQLQVAGVLAPVNSVELVARVPGTVVSVGAHLGQPVSAGEVLFQLRNRSLELQLAQAEATLAQAENGLQEALTNLQLAQSTYRRTHALFLAGAVSSQEEQSVQDQLKSAEIAYQTARQGSLPAALAAVHSLEVELSELTVQSPISGVLASRMVSVGQYVGPGTPLASVVSSGGLEFEATLPAMDTGLLQAGDPCTIQVAGLPGHTFHGYLKAIGPVAIATGQYFPIEVVLPNHQGLLRPGMIAIATFATSRVGPLVPESALSLIGDQEYVYRLAQGEARATQVEVEFRGTHSGQPAAMVSGLPLGTQVVSSKVSELWNGAPIQPVDPQAARP